MKTVTITLMPDECESSEDIALALQEVVRLIREGYTSSNAPQFEITKS